MLTVENSRHFVRSLIVKQVVLHLDLPMMNDHWIIRLEEIQKQIDALVSERAIIFKNALSEVYMQQTPKSTHSLVDTERKPKQIRGLRSKIISCIKSSAVPITSIEIADKLFSEEYGVPYHLFKRRVIVSVSALSKANNPKIWNVGSDSSKEAQWYSRPVNEISQDNEDGAFFLNMSSDLVRGSVDALRKSQLNESKEQKDFFSGSQLNRIRMD